MPHLTLFERIRDDCAFIAENARWVVIDGSEVSRYPERLGINSAASISHSAEHHFLNKGDDTIRFFIILDSINFGSGYFPFLDKERDVSGYFTVAKRLSEYVAKYGIPSPRELQQLTTQRCAAIFRQEMHNVHATELMTLFSISLRDLGSWVEGEYDGDFLGFLKVSNSAEEAIGALLKMKFYRDRFEYFGREVFFLKRAQILLQDIKIACPNHKLIQFHDLNRLTVFADNVLPFVLHADQVLKYDPWLERRIQNDEQIGSGSPEEIELRACSIHSAETVLEIINEEIKSFSARELDYTLWTRGQALKRATNLKRHRTRCVYY